MKVVSSWQLTSYPRSMLKSLLFGISSCRTKKFWTRPTATENSTCCHSLTKCRADMCFENIKHDNTLTGNFGFHLCFRNVTIQTHDVAFDVIIENLQPRSRWVYITINCKKMDLQIHGKAAVILKKLLGFYEIALSARLAVLTLSLLHPVNFQNDIYSFPSSFAPGVKTST